MLDIRKLAIAFALILCTSPAIAQHYTDCPPPPYDPSCSWLAEEFYYSDATFTTVIGYHYSNSCLNYCYQWGVQTSDYSIQHCEICGCFGKSVLKKRLLPVFKTVGMFPSGETLRRASLALQIERPSFVGRSHVHPGS